jgi:hypothetical protein
VKAATAANASRAVKVANVDEVLFLAVRMMGRAALFLQLLAAPRRLG